MIVPNHLSHETAVFLARFYAFAIALSTLESACWVVFVFNHKRPITAHGSHALSLSAANER